MNDERWQIRIACPSLDAAHNGNRTTADRWCKIFKLLGHDAVIVDSNAEADGNLLVALHARKSSPLIRSSKATAPQRPVVLALTGTDLYSELEHADTQRSIELADRIVVLQPLAKQSLPPRFHAKTHTIYQSVERIEPVDEQHRQSPERLDVVVAGHLRDVKDPMRAEQAVRGLPASSKIHVLHFGEILTPKFQELVHDASRKNPRYDFRGQVSHTKLREQLATCWLMVLSSTLEGGANVVSEAIVQGTPVLASRIDGSVGLLGESYSGYFDVKSTQQLRELLLRCEADTTFYQLLQSQVAARSDLFHPESERVAWESLLDGLRPSR